MEVIVFARSMIGDWQFAQTAMYTIILGVGLIYLIGAIRAAIK